MRDCDTGPIPFDPSLRDRESSRERAMQVQAAGLNAAKSLGGGEYLADKVECANTARGYVADDLLRDLENSLNSAWLDIQALRQSLPRRLSPAADRALCELIRAARVRG